MTSRDGAVNTFDSNNTNVIQSKTLHILITKLKFDTLIQYMNYAIYAILSGLRLKKKVALNIKKETFVNLLNWGIFGHTIVYVQSKLISCLQAPDFSISINQLFVGKRYYILQPYIPI